MALKRLDEEFELKPGTQLLPYMKRLLPSLEARFQDLEEVDRMLTKIGEDIRAAALLRMNDILIPATEDILAVTKLGFLLAPISTPYTLVLGYMAMYVDEGVQRDTFTPSPYLIIEHVDAPDDYAIARLVNYDQKTGILEVNITAIHGSPGPHPYMVSSTPGMADSAKLYHDAITPMHEVVVSDHEEVVFLHAEIMAAAQALAESGLDAYAFIRRDGTVPFEALQVGLAPPSNANDNYIPTSGWVRSRIVEYVNTAVKKTGDVMTGPLTIPAYPTQDAHAASKKYVDDAFGAGGTMRGDLTINDSYPSLLMKPTGPQQDRLLEGLNYDGARRWVMALGDGSDDFALYRYGDAGNYLGTGLHIRRSDGGVTLGPISTGYLSNVGGMNIDGDLYLHRGTSGTGVVFLNHTGSAYHYWDGATHTFTGGGGAFHGGMNVHHLNCYSISTQGHWTTTWGMTSHGPIDINGALTIRGDMVLESPNANYIRFWDGTWGNMYIHHNDDNIGFLGHDGGWRAYVNNSSQMWLGAYGWIHDYVNNTASHHAWTAANHRYNEVVYRIRFAHLGDVQHYYNQLQEPWGAGVITGITGCYSSYYVIGRYRQCHMMIAGGWYAASY
jgi:hypothetical protein